MTPSEEVANLCRRLVFCLFQGFSHRLNLSLYRRPKLGTARTAKGQLRLRPYLASGRTVRSERKVWKLPESIKLLQNEPEKAPTVTETSRKFKVATADLRELILKKSTLQLKINKTKTAYTDLLLEMQQLQDTLSKQQQEVTILQQELQDRVQEDQPLTGPNLLQTLQDLGIQVSDEQAAKLAVLRFQVAATEEAKLPNEADKGPPPPPKGADDMDLESPPGLQPASKNQERNGRSRSPKGGDGDKGKAEDNKV